VVLPVVLFLCLRAQQSGCFLSFPGKTPPRFATQVPRFPSTSCCWVFMSLLVFLFGFTGREIVTVQVLNFLLLVHRLYQLLLSQ
jgi:hypothetical protein